MNAFKQKRYVVIEESSVIGVFFHIYDSLNDMRVGVPFYFKDAAEEELLLFASENDFLAIANGVLELVNIKLNTKG